jgi:DNA polymerase bacteriophage-type
VSAARTLFLDTETYSPTPISQGTAKYAERAEVIIVSSAWNREPAQSVAYSERVGNELQEKINAADEIVVHNSFFDRTVLRLAHGILIPTAKIRDTMVLAYAHSLPGGLEVLCKMLKVPQDIAKSKDGKRLIGIFCVPTGDTGYGVGRNTSESHPNEWDQFLDYARLDAEAMREVYRRLPRWNDSAAERALWVLDQKINDFGILIDDDFARAAVIAVGIETKRLNKATSDATEHAHIEDRVRSGTQAAQLLRYLLKYHAVDLPDMQAGTLERRLEDLDLPMPVRELIGLRLSVSTTSTAKYKRVVAALSRDGRLRGSIQFDGAWRTGRWAGRIFQPHNLPRPTIKPYSEIAWGIQAIKAGVAQYTVRDIMRLAASALRGLPIAPPGRKLVVADLSSIESRMISFLAGEEWKLEAFRQFDLGIGWETYILTYANSFRVDPAAVDLDMRQIGKVMDLSLGYQGSVGAFATMMAGYGVHIPEEEILPLVRGWRKAHAAIVSFWYGLDDAAREVIENRDARITVGAVEIDRVGAWMRMRLPSGRFLSYPSPAMKFVKCGECAGRGRVEVVIPETQFCEMVTYELECERCKGAGGKVSITYMGQNPYTKQWARVATYGGKFAAEITQASSRDALGVGMTRADEYGYDIALTVHDEIIAETEDNELYSHGHLAGLMAAPIDWAPGLPLAAKGFEAYRYRKDN